MLERALRALCMLIVVAGLGGAPPAARGQAVRDSAIDDVPVPWHTVERLRPTIATGVASLDEVVTAARAELTLGRPQRARALLAGRDVPGVLPGAVQPLLGAAEFQSGHFALAARHFAKAAEAADGRTRGILAARAGDAFDRAGERDSAILYYRRAAQDLAPIAGWLALREAALTPDTARALALLRRAPQPARTWAARVRGDVYLAAGDTVHALTALAAAGEFGRAAVLALAHRDTALARGYAYRGLDADDSAVARRSLDLVTGTLRPVAAVEWRAVGRAWRGRDARAAVEAVGRAVAAGDTSSATLLLWADAALDAGERRTALAAYDRVAARNDVHAATAAYRRARLLIRAGREGDGYAALERFAERFPDASQAALAIYLIADARRARRVAEAESLFQVVAARWPHDSYGGRARLHLASLTLARGDTAGAIDWYRREIGAQGAERFAARYFMADLRLAAGDAAGARAHWVRLAHEDSLGYWGLTARRALGLAPPAFAPRRTAAPDPSVRRVLEVLDLLRAARMKVEADELVRDEMARRGVPPGRLLDLAEGLIARGWVVEGVTLGWRVAAQASLHDARLLRVIFPWPYRDLIEEEAHKYGLDPYLLAAVIRQESTFRAAVTSRAGARGLMQLMPTTAAAVARRLDVDWDEGLLGVADANVHIGAAHLQTLLRHYDGDLIPALAAYNAGGRPVARWLRFPEAGDPVRFVERIPYVETRGYVKSVLRFQTLYRALYPPAADAVESQ